MWNDVFALKVIAVFLFDRGSRCFLKEVDRAWINTVNKIIIIITVAATRHTRVRFVRRHKARPLYLKIRI
jgi:hypothetical protein